LSYRGLMPGGSGRFMPLTSVVLIGRTLTLNVGTRDWTENPGPVCHSGSGVPPVDRVVISPDHAFTLTFLGQLPVAHHPLLLQ